MFVDVDEGISEESHLRGGGFSERKRVFVEFAAGGCRRDFLHQLCPSSIEIFQSRWSARDGVEQLGFNMAQTSREGHGGKCESALFVCESLFRDV
jgi:hypothetical protein